MMEVQAQLVVQVPPKIQAVYHGLALTNSEQNHLFLQLTCKHET